MIEIKTNLRKWGNSFGVIVPQKDLESTNIKEGDEVIILVRTCKDNVLKEMFGTHKFSKSTKQLMKEMDKELYND
ncbi:hypothetical protein COU57_00945 [Candidatus Pacearchaeota archaeon CG10_big_fil_rev_8_21_14_0_10_32_14]|nr:MAG: hypothetical protein COU57_00945 [Candidatus Pacearchaeota archaeon CG10_big_fil_rev_8_21_14_0_10_32_14]